MSYQDTQLLIHNEWREAASKKSLPVINPATGTEIGRVTQAGQAEMDAALESAANLRSGATRQWLSVSA